MLPSQYIALTHTSSSFPIHGHFLESKRWGEGRRPKLFAGTSLSFGGFIDRIHRERNLNRSLSQVEIEVVSFSPTPTAPTSQCMFSSFFKFSLPSIFTFFTIAPPSQTSAFRTRWDYAASPSKHPLASLPASASTSNPSPSTSRTTKKRKFEDSSDDEKRVDDNGNTSGKKD
jgi:hypothetical protein